VPSLSLAADFVGEMLWPVYARLVQFTLIPGKVSVASVAVAGCIAVLFIATKRKDPKRPLRFKVLIRAMFPRRVMRSPSSKADVWYFIINLFVFGSFLGWAVLSYVFVSHAVSNALVGAFGSRPAILPDFASGCILTVVLFLAFELGYWIDHYLSHNVPFLWEFHKVHHSAEVLTPLTDFRVHPVDTLVFNNILSIVMGGAGGLVVYLLGRDAEPFNFANSNILTLILAYCLMHLQHSHFWIVFTGIWGRLFLSPAHHQVHHSIDPAHFNKNLGSFIGIWDWAFGTLHVPDRQREKLTFGVAPVAETRHTMREGFIAPFARAWATLTLPQGVQDFIDDSGAQELPRSPEPVRLVSMKVAD
jgi:sterol desaturase/sphingolipid hydroxylase (fatty acid hydroxylase superfamily)